MGAVLDIAEKRVDAYSSSNADDWKLDHKLAMLCFDIQELMREGADIFDDLHSLENDWREDVCRGAIDYCEDFESRLTGLYERWFRASVAFLAVFDQSARSEYISRGFDAKPVQDLRGRVEKAKNFLTPDEKFFAHDATYDLAERAVQEHTEGRTEPCELG